MTERVDLRVQRGAWALATVITAATVAGCASESFAESDPVGYEACGDHAAYRADGGMVSQVGGSMAVAETARRASTKAIRDAASENLIEAEHTGAESIPMLDVEAFEEACTDAGFEFD